jgi:hypothetical protein
MSMPNKKKKSKTKLSEKDRLNDARRWLRAPACPRSKLLKSYQKRYGVKEEVAHIELIQLGYRDELMISEYEAKNIKWEYKVEPLSGELLVVPEGTGEHELYG